LGKIVEAIENALKSTDGPGYIVPVASRYTTTAYFTHIRLDESDVPWDIESPWMDEKEGKDSKVKAEEWARTIHNAILEVEISA